MKIMIVSDSHRDNRNFLNAIDAEEPIDMLIHCGDVEGSEYIYEEAVSCPVHIVAGNNDFFSDLNREEEFMIGNLKVFLVHGHQYRVYGSTQYLLEEGRDRKADIVMFGHTHSPLVENHSGIWIVNPGSISYPRQSGRKCTYMIMEYNIGQEPRFEVKYVPAY